MVNPSVAGINLTPAFITVENGAVTRSV